MSLLADLIERDGSACVWCGRELWRTDLTVEHLLPRTRGGHTTLENLAVACRACNRARGARSLVAYVRARALAGARPRIAVLEAALARLGASSRRAHAAYGARQLELLLEFERESLSASSRASDGSPANLR